MEGGRTGGYCSPIKGGGFRGPIGGGGGICRSGEGAIGG